MYIGLISNDISPKFYHANTHVPFEPTASDDGGFVWNLDTIFDTFVDIKYSFGEERYVGSVKLNVTGVTDVSVIVDGVKVAVPDTQKAVTVNLCGKELIIRARGNICAASFKGAEIYGFIPSETKPFLIPSPKSIKYEDGFVAINRLSSECDDGLFACEFLSESLSERFESLSANDGITLSFIICPEYESERYTVSVTKERATVKAADRLALLWGACRIIDLWNNGGLPLINVDDKPDVSMRGFHMGLPCRERIDFFKRFVRYVLLPLGYNHVILEFNGDMRYDTHPEITEEWLEAERLFREGNGERVMHADIGAEGTALEKPEVRELVESIEQYGIEVIPEVQSLSHIEYITNAHPEFAELRKILENATEEELSKICHTNIDTHCYCPSEPLCMQLIFDIMDEIIEVVKPKRYVHIGHDEVYHIGLCPECRKKGGPRVYVDHVRAMYDHLKAKGLGTMLWSDMLHTDLAYTGDDYAEVKHELPKDMVLLDFTWYFHFDKDIEDDILPAEYKNVMMGNLYSSHYPRFKERISKSGMIGGEVSTWTAVSEEKFAENGKFFDLPYTSEMLWNAYGYDENNRVALTALIGQCVIPEMRELLHGRYDLFLATKSDGFTFSGDVSEIPRELSHLNLVKPKGKMRVRKRYDRLIFEHATLNPAPRICWKELVPVGRYTVTYTDGACVEIPVDYAGGILYYGSHFGRPMPQQYYRHQGYVGTWFADPTYESYTSEGHPILLLGQVWDNPHPEKKISYITYTPNENDCAVLISGGVIGIKV